MHEFINNHSGGCCGIKQFPYRPNFRVLHKDLYTSKFIYKVFFKDNERERLIEDLTRLRGFHPRAKAVIMGNCCWFVLEPARARVKNYPVAAEATFRASYPLGTRQQHRILYGFNTYHDRRVTEFPDEFLEVALVTAQCVQFHGSLIQHGFQNVLASINPNTGNKISLYLKGPVEPVRFPAVQGV
jgi:hypothetical protein